MHVHRCSMPADPSVNLYQSHQQKYHNYAMATPSVQRLPSESLGGEQAVTRSLNNAFYTTSYQSDIARYAGKSAILIKNWIIEVNFNFAQFNAYSKFPK